MPVHHPLRRVSTGSLSSLARSQDRSHASPSGLDFLQPAMTELADEAATLAANVARMTELHDALGTFNESFAAFLFALKMNAFCVEWPQAPDDNSFARAETLVAEVAAPEERAEVRAAEERPTTPPSTHFSDLTYATVHSVVDEPPRRATSSTAKRPLTKKPNTAAKKKRDVSVISVLRLTSDQLEIATIIDTLPLEYRGNDLSARTAMTKVIGTLMDRPQGVALRDVVSPPDVPQPRANKCLIALVAKKLVAKTTVGMGWRVIRL